LAADAPTARACPSPDARIMGAIPRLSERNWRMHLAKYHAFPQYFPGHRALSLEAFKGIFLVEGGFPFPWVASWAWPSLWPFGLVRRHGRINAANGRALCAVCSGACRRYRWWMVTSGLETRVSSASTLGHPPGRGAAVVVLSGDRSWTYLRGRQAPGMSNAPPVRVSGLLSMLFARCGGAACRD